MVFLPKVLILAALLFAPALALAAQLSLRTIVARELVARSHDLRKLGRKEARSFPNSASRHTLFRRSTNPPSTFNFAKEIKSIDDEVRSIRRLIEEGAKDENLGEVNKAMENLQNKYTVLKDAMNRHGSGSAQDRRSFEELRKMMEPILANHKHYLDGFLNKFPSDYFEGKSSQSGSNGRRTR